MANKIIHPHTHDDMKRLLSLLSLLPLSLAAQHRPISLEETITLARAQSVEATVALGEMRSAYWQHRTYRANLLPEIGLQMTLPSYERGYSLYQSEDGSYKFVPNNALQMQGRLSIEQNIWLTGGKLSLHTSLQHIDPLGTPGARKSFLSVPIGLTYAQPLFGTNEIRWQRRIEPLRYEEARTTYIEASEQLSMRAVTYFFELLLAKENHQIAEQNKRNADRIYEIAAARRRMGQISENELLQLRLAALKAGSTLTSQESALRAAMFRLRSFLALSESEDLDPLTPEWQDLPRLEYREVLDRAMLNGSFAKRVRRQQLEADYQVAVAKGQQRDIHLFASIGYTGRGDDLRSAYSPLIDNQRVEVGISLPLVDWGKRRGKVRVAESNRQVARARLEKDEQDFRQDLYLLVERYNNQAAQLLIAQEASDIATKRYETSVESFMIGKINTLDLADAQLSKDNARAKYLSEMHLYWYYLYQIRSLTLWDYLTGQALAPIDDHQISG